MKRNADIEIFYKATTVWEQDVGGYIPSRGRPVLRPGQSYHALIPDSALKTFILDHYNTLLYMQWRQIKLYKLGLNWRSVSHPLC